MKIIHSGGANGTILKDDPEYTIHGFGNYFMLQVKHEILALIKRKKIIAVCVAAKPNKSHYNQRFADMGFDLKDFVFLGREDKPAWEDYHAILMLGGETKELHSWLVESAFNIKDLKQCELIAGDSAGAYVLAKHTLIDYEVDGSRYEIADGFIPDLDVLITAHINNDNYHQAGLEIVLKDWCQEHRVKYVGLEENQIKESIL